MSIFSTYADKADAAVDRNRAALDRAVAAIAQHDADPRKDSDDADERFDWKRELRDLEDRHDAAAEALALSSARAEHAKAEAADKAADALHVAAERQAKTDEKLVRGALSAIEKAIAEIEAVAASVARTDDHNAERGTRAFITDAEKRVRQRPGRTIEARYEDREFWRDGSGREATVLRKNERGAMVPMEAGFTKVRERVCVQPARHETATMPERLAELLPALKKALGA